MTTPPDYPRLCIRVDPRNRNHHLWNNNGTWYLHYTVLTTPVTAERVRRSLGTGDVDIARRKRDLFLKEASHVHAA